MCWRLNIKRKEWKKNKVLLNIPIYLEKQTFRIFLSVFNITSDTSLINLYFNTISGNNIWPSVT